MGGLGSEGWENFAADRLATKVIAFLNALRGRSIGSVARWMRGEWLKIGFNCRQRLTAGHITGTDLDSPPRLSLARGGDDRARHDVLKNGIRHGPIPRKDSEPVGAGWQKKADTDLIMDLELAPFSTDRISMDEQKTPERELSAEEMLAWAEFCTFTALLMTPIIWWL